MQWLNNSVLKDVQIDAGQSATSIVTTLPIFPKIMINKECSAENGTKETTKTEAKIAATITRERQLIAEERAQLQQEKETILAQAQAAAEELRQATAAECQQLKETTYQEAYQSGQQAGQKDGYQAGWQEAQVAATQMIAQAKENVETLLIDSQTFIASKKSEWTSASVQMAEALIKKQFEMDQTTILNVLEPIWLEIERPDQLLVVRAHPVHAEVLTSKLEEKKKEMPNFRFSVLKETKFSPCQVEIESDEVLMTFDLQEELQLFLTKLEGLKQDEI